jgi:hypothetical protein
VRRAVCEPLVHRSMILVNTAAQLRMTVKHCDKCVVYNGCCRVRALQKSMFALRDKWDTFRAQVHTIVQQQYILDYCYLT